jgi:hypothetical protein
MVPKVSYAECLQQPHQHRTKAEDQNTDGYQFSELFWVKLLFQNRMYQKINMLLDFNPQKSNMMEIRVETRD